MNPLLQVQGDFEAKLLSEEYFADLKVKAQRKLVIESEVDLSLLVLAGRGGKNGAGVLVEMPQLTARAPNLPAPETLLRAGLLVAENPILNQAAGGTGKSAEEIAVEVLRTLHPLRIAGLGSFYAAEDAIAAVPEPPEELAGCVVYRVALEALVALGAPLRCELPLVEEEGGGVTFTDRTGGCAIYYTMDGGFPGPGNAGAALYEGPFSAAAGMVLRWAAYKSGWQGSDVGHATVTP